MIFVIGLCGGSNETICIEKCFFCKICGRRSIMCRLSSPLSGLVHTSHLTLNNPIYLSVCCRQFSRQLSTLLKMWWCGCRYIILLTVFLQGVYNLQIFTHHFCYESILRHKIDTASRQLDFSVYHTPVRLSRGA